jgi:ABC-type cobalamin/Fe3+-siderophores transport system ATPase subunit
VLLHATDLRFSYGGPLVVDGVSLAIERGTAVGILGPNGSGKTTLLRLIAGATAPSTGQVLLDGRPLSEFSRRAVARRLAVVPQETELAFDYSVLEVVLMGRYPHLGAFEIEGPRDVEAAHTALDATGTRAFADRPFRTLSGGEKQRVIIASALAQVAAVRDQGPDALLLLDEPTASLDLKYQLEIAALLRRLRAERGITMLLTTHDLHFARAVCTKIVLLSHGRVLASGTPDEMIVPPLMASLYDVDPAAVESFVTQ